MLDPGADEVAVAAGVEDPALEAGAPKLKLGVDMARELREC